MKKKKKYIFFFLSRYYNVVMTHLQFIGTMVFLREIKQQQQQLRCLFLKNILSPLYLSFILKDIMEFNKSPLHRGWATVLSEKFRWL